VKSSVKNILERKKSNEWIVILPLTIMPNHLNLETIVPLAKANHDAKFIIPKPWAPILIEAGIEENRVLGAIFSESLCFPSKRKAFLRYLFSWPPT
jgi:hypothetical protein